MRQRAEEAASRLPPLMVAADHVAATVAQGVHGRRRVGQGDSFWQFRQYQPGDPLSRIDWRQTAKRQHVFIRETEWEAAESVWLWADGSASMHFGSRLAQTTKLERARLILMSLAVLLVRGDENIALLGADRRPRTGSAALTRFATRLIRNAENEPPSLPALEILPKHAQLVLVGDFLEPLEQLEAMIKHFAGLGVTGHMVQILDPAEETLPYAGRILFDGLEQEGTMLASRAEALRSDYVTRLHAHREELARLTRAVRWSFTTHHTDSQPQAALLPLYIDLAGQVT